MIMMFRQASCSFPHDIIEAARLDGLSETGIFFRMYMPTMKSTYAAATIITLHECMEQLSVAKGYLTEQ